MIENGIARLYIAQKIDKRDLIALRARERAHNKVEISRSEPRPTIRPDHRDFIMRGERAYGKSEIFEPRIHTDQQQTGIGSPASCRTRQAGGPPAKLSWKLNFQKSSLLTATRAALRAISDHPFPAFLLS
jgi:hypothetical protein